MCVYNGESKLLLPKEEFKERNTEKEYKGGYISPETESERVNMR